MHKFPKMRTRTLSVYVNEVMLTLAMASGALLQTACTQEQRKAAQAEARACAKAEENKLMDQAVQALLATAAKDASTVGAFLNALASDAAQVGVGDAISFVTCVAEAVRAKLVELASHAALNPGDYQAIQDELTAWERAHPVGGGL